MAIVSKGRGTSDMEALRRIADMLCLWRLCAKDSCRRARSCRGSAYRCGRRNFRALPEGVRAFFADFLAAKHAGLAFDQFKREIEGSDELAALCAWRRAAEGKPR